MCVLQCTLYVVQIVFIDDKGYAARIAYAL